MINSVNFLVKMKKTVVQKKSYSHYFAVLKLYIKYVMSCLGENQDISENLSL
jgi:hypothetical protein